MSINSADLVNSSGSPFSSATTGSIAQQEGATPNITGGANASHSNQTSLNKYRGPIKEIPPPIAVSKPPQAAVTAQTFDYYSNQEYSNPSQTVTAAPRTQKSYADLTCIPLDTNTTKKLQELDDPIQQKLQGHFDTRWDRITSKKKPVKTITVKEAMDIQLISGRKDIINLTGNFPIKKIPIIDKLTEIKELYNNLKTNGTLTKRLGKYRAAIYDAISHTSSDEQMLGLDAIKKLNSVYKGRFRKNLFDLNSVRSKAIQVANEQIEKERTHSQSSSTSKKRSNHELTSSESNQPEKKRPRVRREQDDRKQQLEVAANPFNYQQQFHVPREGYYYSQLEPIGTGSLQQQNEQPQHNNAFPSQQAQHTPTTPHEQYYNYQMTQTNAVLIQQQNSQYQQNDFPFPQNSSSQPEQIGTSSLQQQNNQTEQNDFFTNDFFTYELEEYPQFQLNNSSQPEQIGTCSLQQPNNQPEQNDFFTFPPKEDPHFFE